jgi:hypothetical protein
MKYYDKIQTITLDFTLTEKARKFAQNVYSTTNYSDSNQFSNQKIINDHFISKIGEEAVKKVLSAYAVVDGPDYNVYDLKQKSWSDDLYVNKTGVAVKTQKRSAALKYSLSWTFQSGTNRRDIILDKPDAWVVFVEYNDLDSHTCYVYPPFQIKELNFGEPRLDYLKQHKKVVYAMSLPMKLV